MACAFYYFTNRNVFVDVEKSISFAFIYIIKKRQPTKKIKQIVRPFELYKKKKKNARICRLVGRVWNTCSWYMLFSFFIWFSRCRSSLSSITLVRCGAQFAVDTEQIVFNSLKSSQPPNARRWRCRIQWIDGDRKINNDGPVLRSEMKWNNNNVNNFEK